CNESYFFCFRSCHIISRLLLLSRAKRIRPPPAAHSFLKHPKKKKQYQYKRFAGSDLVEKPKNRNYCHARLGGHPEETKWIPAFAGMTLRLQLSHYQEINSFPSRIHRTDRSNANNPTHRGRYRAHLPRQSEWHNCRRGKSISSRSVRAVQAEARAETYAAVPFPLCIRHMDIHREDGEA